MPKTLFLIIYAANQYMNEEQVTVRAIILWCVEVCADYVAR